ncbi:MAG: phosphate ABC transporter, permease protein PstA [Ignavibacteria bacterium GWA2_55_11]|nr:MAG: phosphate ABC transporter, permease protein PstA [Ignavibacteria bacterium GWA2_55_11]OGU47640.1 MAG: phosphate ABC transporter, permease protein PstA [Ignavibacteria bacterium GWC2_56_12]OGU62702.1 MAG: phosphate ABC transporter, permease protein PstA [Ignavibacteria bacterium RIFCSPHIGHO2_02_FULL_56_12]OGU70519.1 MAG: phosphate ABC transporter, permease protein PstA [Ignavibacteria bacterium RIFCSPLOWO2_02_FULL_55_14]OGU72383.1 MAG: phosphate ABC transporter, permease protein PstA [Ig
MRIPPRFSQRLAIAFLGGATLVTLVILVAIIVFILEKGLLVLGWEFLFSSPKDMGRAGGIFPTLIGTVLLPLLAIIIATPLGVSTSVYLTEYTRESKTTRVIRFGTDCLAGIPSIIFGLFGFIFFVTTLGMGWSIMSGGLTLAFMILPTIIRTTEEAIRAVPKSYREVSFSLGATRWQTTKRVVLPNALPGILTGVMLGIGRSIGETAAVIFTAGSSLRIPESVFDSTRTMAVHFYILAREGISTENAYGTAAVLIIAVLAVNLLAYWLMNRFIARRS